MNQKGASPAFAVYTLGCKVNQEEGASICRMLEERGWQRVNFNDKAAVYIINTCTVTHLADRKSRAIIRRAVRNNPRGLIVVTGCYAQISGKDLANLEGVGLIAGVDQRADLPELIEKKLNENTPGVSLAVEDISSPHSFVALPVAGDKNRTRAYLKIEDGCDEFCHYCIIPYARGPVRSLAKNKVLEALEQLIKEGYLEIVLTGIHVGAYGQDLEENINLASLLKEAVKLPGLGRLRLGSIEPLQFTEELLNFLREDAAAKEPKICPHLHIPLQSGCDKTLKAMGRNYTCAEYLRLINELRSFSENIAITSDIMVGYPGETENDFCECSDFCKNIGFSRLHVFPYSPRRNTVAADLPGQTPPQEKENRSKRLINLGDEMAKAYGKSFIGKALRLLPERIVKDKSKKYLQGHSENYLNLWLPYTKDLPKGFISVKGGEWQNGKLLVKMEEKA